jgi:HlyD family secretion protein
VIIRLNSYPYNEFGTLKGCVSYIPEVPFKDTAFLLNVQLDNGLKTTYNKTLLFKNNLVGNADIITEDLKLSDRFLYTFKQLVSR